MNRLQALWGRLGNTERLVIAVGVPLVALAAIWSSHNAKGKKPATDTAAAATGTPQTFTSQPWDFLRELDPILKTVEKVPKDVAKEVEKIPPKIDVVVPPIPEGRQPTVPPNTGPVPSDHYPGVDNRTVAYTANDLFYKDPSGRDFYALIDTLAYRIHVGQLWIGDYVFFENGDGNGTPLAIRGPVVQRLSQAGW